MALVSMCSQLMTDDRLLGYRYEEVNKEERLLEIRYEF